jgi:hypothetical protein
MLNRGKTQAFLSNVTQGTGQGGLIDLPNPGVFTVAVVSNHSTRVPKKGGECGADQRITNTDCG